MSKEIEYKVDEFVKANELLQFGDEVVIGVSGGADSMALFHYLYKRKGLYNLTLKVAHVHHGIREEAEADARLVEAICKERNIPYYRHDCNIKVLARQRQKSEEEVGREERYNFFISLLKQNGKIVTAHNMNDQAETLLMRFFRGTDIGGLSGIPPRRDKIIRPFLCLTRKEIETYCRSNEIIYRDDHTNFETIYTRNKIRLECIPYIEEQINPSIVRSLGEHSNLYREEETFLKGHTEELFRTCATLREDTMVIDINVLNTYHEYMQRRIILLSLQKLINTTKNITSKHVEMALSLVRGQSGKEAYLPYNIRIRREFTSLIIGNRKDEKVNYEYNLSLGTTVIPEANLEITLSLIEKERIEQKDEKIYTKYIDYGKMKNDLHLRTRQSGDYIATPLGTKKIKKLFIDDKVPQALRDNIPLLVSGSEVIWVIGGRLSTDYYITQQTTQILQLKVTYSS